MTEWLSERGIGHRYRGVLIPIVAGAVIFDLAFADPTVYPTADWGRRAAAAAQRWPVRSGRGMVHPVTGDRYASGSGSDIPLRYHQRDPEPDAVRSLTNTTRGLVAPNACLTKPQVTKIAELAHDGLVRAIRPVHAMFDGDAIFALASLTDPVASVDTTGAHLTNRVGHAASDAMVRAVLAAARETTAADGWPSVAEA